MSSGPFYPRSLAEAVSFLRGHSASGTKLPPASFEEKVSVVLRVSERVMDTVHHELSTGEGGISVKMQLNGVAQLLDMLEEFDGGPSGGANAIRRSILRGMVETTADSVKAGEIASAEASAGVALHVLKELRKQEVEGVSLGAAPSVMDVRKGRATAPPEVEDTALKLLLKELRKQEVEGVRLGAAPSVMDVRKGRATAPPEVEDTALKLLREYRAAPKFSNDHAAIKRTVALEDQIDAFLESLGPASLQEGSPAKRPAPGPR